MYPDTSSIMEYSFSMTQVIFIILGLLGTGGLTTIIVTLLNRGKVKGETEETKAKAKKVQAEMISIQEETQQNLIRFLSEKLDTIQQQNKKDIDRIEERNEKLLSELKTQNQALSNEIDDLIKRSDQQLGKIDSLESELREIAKWIFGSNMKYRHWLERELRKRDPEIEIPECPEPPKVFNELLRTMTDAEKKQYMFIPPDYKEGGE